MRCADVPRPKTAAGMIGSSASTSGLAVRGSAAPTIIRGICTVFAWSIGEVAESGVTMSARRALARASAWSARFRASMGCASCRSCVAAGSRRLGDPPHASKHSAVRLVAARIGSEPARRRCRGVAFRRQADPAADRRRGGGAGRGSGYPDAPAYPVCAQTDAAHRGRAVSYPPAGPDPRCRGAARGAGHVVSRRSVRGSFR